MFQESTTPDLVDEHKQEAQDLGNGAVFAVALLNARPARSAGRMQGQWGFTVTWAAGMIVRVLVAQDIEKARAAAERLAEERGWAMSQEEVDLVMGLQRSGEEDFARLIREDERWQRVADGAAPIVHEDAVSVRPGVPGAKEYLGLDGFRRMWLDWLAPWAEYRTAIEQVIDCGERVLLLQRSSGRMHGSTQEVELSPGVVWTVRAGKIARFEVYAERTQALKAVGMADE